MDRILKRRANLGLCGALLVGLIGVTPAMAVDAGHGKQVFAQKCAVCHSAAKGGHAVIGPPLYGVVGRQAASVDGFKYSTAMKAVGYAWTDDKLKLYLASPKTVVPGTKMVFAGLTDAGKLDDLVAYLDTLK